MQSYITKLGNFWARQRRSLVAGGGRQQVSHRWALHLLCIPSPRTVCLSVSSPQTHARKPQNQLLLSIISVFPRPGVEVGFFLVFSSSSTDAAFLSAHLTHMSVLCGSRYRGAERVNISQSCHTVRLGRLLMRGAWRSFLGVGGRGQTVSVSVSAYTVICS